AIGDLVVTAIDASERREAREILHHRLAYEKLISSISSYFVNLSSDEIDNGIVDTLGAICLFVGGDRAYVAQLSEDQRQASMTHEWCAEGIASRKQKFQGVPVRSLPFLRERLSAMDVVTIRSIDDLPPEAIAERDVYLGSGNKTVIAVPMIAKKTVVGFIGLNGVRGEIPLTDETVALLRIASEIFVGALQREKSERALRSSEERHRLLFERNVAGVYRSSMDGTIVECNDALAWMLGFSNRGELLRMRASDLYFSSDERRHFIEQLRRHGSLPDFELRLRKKDGKPLWVLESVHLVSENGEELIEGTVLDITDRKETENALRESELRYRTLIEQMREGLTRQGTDGRLQFVNDKFCEMVGYRREELLGRDPAEFLLANAEDAQLFRAKAASGISGLPDRYEVRVRRKDGIVIWVEVAAAPVLDANGTVIGVIGVHYDITARRIAEEALRESESRYRLMADNSTDLISRSSGDGIVLYVSPSVLPLLGYEPSEVIGQPVLQVVHPEDHEHVRHFTRVVKRSGSATFTWRALRRDGSTVWLETTTRAIADREVVHEYVSVSRDITERKHAEAQIEYQAYHDALTSLPNRLLFRDRLTIALAHARRVARPLAVMFVDLDSFKFVNDTFGHSFGDELLKIVAARIRSALREEDTIARMGGDEFTILIANLASPGAAVTIAQKLLNALSEPVLVEGHELFVTASVGIAVFPDDGDSA
ncbi:MAG TPA: PAS domain S-box protein, partial [Thermoanaerobaculia bacterium]|nr:PAS domain S-box protein [Thermoanaerobaculia bacterium]